MENPKQFYKAIGRRIADARQSMHMSQEDAADKLNITRVTWNHIEKGNQKLTLDRLIDIAGLLQIAPTKLVPGLVSSDETDVLTEKNFSSDEQALILERLDKYKKQKK
ncbi:MAG TPA: helix-turn-helix transcriptional regulator [Leptospiraceae bacterium]|nr:helix-turn-helix transcriptional regulator [Leptospiraceae bacterium]HMW06648.1 helix-turn-helix transcriptional regulator [Leptospiraceae bacterium]HMX35123.1 helix-turn-helix transcriptional regulator [Leptospiraceae bacterium]HMY33699.1 helix-turn-helix transcriptional regulator [Leptospiraceae bacterium]HMZ64903.1 helix-turn-helix transcriptional regulator [Leptospiraceae bacterium]